MRCLLDSHTLLWYTLDDPQLSKTAESLILDPTNEIFTSPASYWEIAIKVSIGKLELHSPFGEFVDVCLNKYGFRILPIEPKHAAALIDLPFHHRDPFDRMLIAQAMMESVQIIGNDRAFDAYSVKRLW